MVLLIPIVTAFWFGTIALRDQENSGRSIWSRFREPGRLILTATIAAWWAISELRGVPRIQSPLFWTLPVLSLGLFLAICYGFDRKLLKLRWSRLNIVWRAGWKIVALVIPLLALAVGCHGLMERNLWSTAWLIAAGIVAKVGTGFSRWADGMRFNFLKTGETRNRALATAQEMSIRLRRVFIVPAGKGHLTNAFGTGDAIGLTDNLGKYLTRDQSKFVIAHELAHLKLKHGRKQLMMILAVYPFLALILFLLAPVRPQYRAIFSFVITVLPVIVSFWFSRRMEYAADRAAVQFTQDPETAIRALARLHKSNELPAQRGPLVEIFASHPCFDQRALAIARDGEVSISRLGSILEDERVEIPRNLIR